MLQWDVWDGKLTHAKAREARANLESAREEQRKVRLALSLEVEEARLELKAATERLAVTREAVSQALESASLTQARFQQGAALSTQLMDAETALTTMARHRCSVLPVKQNGKIVGMVTRSYLANAGTEIAS